MKSLTYLLLSVLLICACQDEKSKKPMKKSELFSKVAEQLPTLEKRPKSLKIHGDERIDSYYWLNDRNDPDVIAYLEAENKHVDHSLSHTRDFQAALYDEMVGRIKKDDSTVPYRDNGFYYTTKYQSGQEYPIYMRGTTPEADQEIMLDQNEMAADYSFHSLSGLRVSPNNKLLLFGEDTLSRRIYTLRFKDLTTGQFLSDAIPNTSSNAAWASDNKTIFYTVRDEALRPYKVYRHVIGTDISEDELIFHESDETFSTYIYRSKSDKYLIIGSYSTLSSEFRILEADNPSGSFRIFHPREQKLEYEIEHFDDQFYILTNLNAQNFQIMKTPESSTTKSSWTTLIAHRPQVFLEDMDIFKDFMVITERDKGITKLRVMPFDGADYYIDFGESVYTAYTTRNYDFDTDIVRIGYTSMTTPTTTFDYYVKTKDLQLLKQQEVLGDFDQKNYATKQIQAKARDGKLIPISIVYRKGYQQDGSHPLYLIGYGSYGSSYDPTFSSVRLSLLDRGFIIGIAHIRGGQELGRPWYEDGKLLNKKNTFTDFIDCALHMSSNKYADPDRIFAYGGSAGGLLMGAVTNMRPDLWAGIVSAVPFVDVVTTMLDETIPLTTGEYDEWGNPNDKEYYDYMKSYSPYDNIEAKNYPPILVTTGLHDSQVQYWEPAKYVAKLREYKTDANPLLFHTNLDAGHGGDSGRFRRLKEWAMHYTFVLDLAGEMESTNSSELKD